MLIMADICRFGTDNYDTKSADNIQSEKLSFVNIFCIFLSLITILADLTTDIILFVEYCKRNNFYWALGCILFVIVPTVFIHIFSMRWLLSDLKADLKHWCTHIVLVGVIYRYIVFFKKTLSKEPTPSRTLLAQRNDLVLLHFLFVFIGTVPQIILQSYSVIILPGNYYTRVISLAVSIISVLWASTMYIVLGENRQTFHWTSFTLKFFWNFGMLIARITGVLIFTVIFGIWTLVPMGIHWAAMTFWIITQKTTFCPNKLEETFYNVVMGFISCFCYINMCEGQTRYRLVVFYSLMVTQNFASLFLFILISDSKDQKKLWALMATAFIVAGTVIGILSMLLYYRWFHAKGPITWKNVDVELNNQVHIEKKELRNNVTDDLKHVRSFKSQQNCQTMNDQRKESEVSGSIKRFSIATADKKFLLDHWIARSGTPTFVSVPVGNDSIDVSGLEFHTVENTPQSVNFTKSDVLNAHSTGKLFIKHKKLKICSPTELNLKLSAIENLESSIDELTSIDLNLKKRRGICSSDVLREDLESDMNCEDFNKISENGHCSVINHDTNGSNKKSSSDSIDMDLDLSFSDINSSDINTFNENIVQKLCLSALKNIKVGNQDADIENIQRIALDILKEMYAKKGKNKKTDSDVLVNPQRELNTPTEMLSVHDYENICAVNIAREAWGLRSWNGYIDIENWLHDGSVVRDRRHDTFTSGSSEISSSVSQELKNCILSVQQVPPKKMPCYSNVCIKHDKSLNDYVNAIIYPSDRTNDSDIREIKLRSELTFVIPDNVDNITNHLEPIIEELDDLGDLDPPSKKRLNSESSLVATIDEIRKATVTNSPKCLYNRREHLWNSPQLESNLKRALWKEPSKFDSSNILESLPEKENILNEIQRTKFDEKLNEYNISIMATNSKMSQPINSFLVNKNIRERQKPSNLKTQIKKVNIANESLIVQDLSNTNIDYLSQLVSEKSIPQGSTEVLSTNQITSSLQSLIIKDSTLTPLVNNAAPAKSVSSQRKTAKSKPRRKFSLLREKFEPKASVASDEEILYQYPKNFKPKKQSQTLQKEHSQSVLKNQIHIDNGNTAISSEKLLNVPRPETHKNTESINAPEITINVKEKRSIFMKQVLSPPKFSTKLKYKT